MSLELQKLNHFKEFATDAGIAGIIGYINSLGMAGHPSRCRGGLRVGA